MRGSSLWYRVVSAVVRIDGPCGQMLEPVLPTGNIEARHHNIIEITAPVQSLRVGKLVDVPELLPLALKTFKDISDLL